MKHILAIAAADLKDGVIHLRDKKKFNSLLVTYTNQPVYVTVERMFDERSDQQNKYYWGVVVEHQRLALEEITGEQYTKQDIHDFNKSKFFCKEILVGDEVLCIPLSSKDFDIKEFSDVIEHIRKWTLITLNYNIPEPNKILS